MLKTHISLSESFDALQSRIIGSSNTSGAIILAGFNLAILQISMFSEDFNLANWILNLKMKKCEFM